jgi:cell volume regulation protein A
MGGEPISTAVLLTAFGVLLAVSVGLSRASARLGLPIVLLFLFVGVMAGSEGIGGIAFDDYQFAYRVGTVALVFILFDGGLNTSFDAALPILEPSVLLATVGVLFIAAIVGGAAHLLGLSWPLSMLLGAIVSSTDAAAVFAMLNASGTRLRKRVGLTLEVESGLNDPMAVILTSVLTAALVGTRTSLLSIGGHVLLQMVVGAVVGYLVARIGRWLILRIRLPAAGLYPGFTLAIACLSYGIATLFDGSGFLSVFVTGMTLGSGALPHAVGIRRVHVALGWLSQVVMFLLLGLLVSPSRLMNVAPIGFALALFLAFIARPVVVMLGLKPFNYPWRESAFVGWVGLRGAVPIVLATIPVMAGAPAARELFDVVFFIVVVGAFVPGATVTRMARWLGVESHAPPPPSALVEVDALRPQGDELRAYFVSSDLAVCGATLSEIPFPAGAAVSMLERGGSLIAPSGSTRLEPGDYVYVIAPVEDRPHVELLFGLAEEH